MTAAAERTVRMAPTPTVEHPVPVTARLSRNFYDKFGDEAVNELVDWMNAVDLGYRTDLLRINEANVARFNATIEARISEFRAEVNKGFAELRAEMNERFAELRAEINERFATMRGDMALRADVDKGFAELRADVAMRADMDERFARVERQLAGLAGLDARFARFEARVLKWILVFWTTSMVGTAAIVFAALQAQ